MPVSKRAMQLSRLLQTMETDVTYLKLRTFLEDLEGMEEAPQVTKFFEALDLVERAFTLVTKDVR